MAFWNTLRIDHKSRIPLAAQLSQQLNWLILSGQIKTGDKLPPVRQLGQQLDISFLTVRAAYQQLERDGIVETRHGVGTTILPSDISTLGRKSRSLPSFTIGVIVPAYTEFYGPLLQGIHNASRSDPTLLFICDSHEDPTLTEYYLDQLIAKGVDGIILVAREIRDQEKLAYIIENAPLFPPIVFADIPTYPPPLILFDLEGGAYSAARHILDHGHSRVGIIIPPRSWKNVAEIYRGYERAFDAFGLSIHPEWVAEVPDFTLEFGYTSVQSVLNLENPPTAILAAGDLLAVGALRWIKERGLKVPDDIALIGFDDSKVSTLVEPQLTTVILPAYEMGEKAYSLLQNVINERISNEESFNETEILLETELIIRQSCGCKI